MLKEVVHNIKQLACGFQEAQTTIARAFTAIYSASSELTAAQFHVSSLIQSISVYNILLGISPPEHQDTIWNELKSLKEQLSEARAIKATRAAKVKALHTSQTAALLPQKSISFLSANVPDLVPSTSHKHPWLDVEDTLEESQVQEMITSIEVDQQVHSILTSLSDFFETFFLLLDKSATHIDFLLKGLDGCTSFTFLVPSFSMKPFPTKSFSTQLSSISTKLSSSASSSSLKKLPSMPSLFPFLSVLFIFIICISLFPPVCAFPSAASLPISSSFHTMPINMNGLHNPMKLNTIQNMVKDTQPHIVVIEETKSANEVGS